MELNNLNGTPATGKDVAKAVGVELAKGIAGYVGGVAVFFGLAWAVAGYQSLKNRKKK